MKEFDELYPEYKLAKKNKGYGTKEHVEALKTYGACPLHRKNICTDRIRFLEIFCSVVGCWR